MEVIAPPDKVYVTVDTTVPSAAVVTTVYVIDPSGLVTLVTVEFIIKALK